MTSLPTRAQKLSEDIAYCPVYTLGIDATGCLSLYMYNEDVNDFVRIMLGPTEVSALKKMLSQKKVK